MCFVELVPAPRHAEQPTVRVLESDVAGHRVVAQLLREPRFRSWASVRSHIQRHRRLGVRLPSMRSRFPMRACSARGPAPATGWHLSPVACSLGPVRALVIAHGTPPSPEVLREFAEGADLLVCADGGLLHARDAGIQPHAVVGDLDSLAEDDIAHEAARIVRDTNPDATDLEKAVAWAIAAGATDVDVACAGGGRADHAIANLSILTINRGRARVRVIDDLFEISLVDGQIAIEGEPGTVISLVAIGTCTGVTTSGLRWDLDEHRLSFSPYGVHNEIRESPASVSVASGDLLLFKGRWVEKHR
ncbi:MAG: thiamine diphosphokinase [Dehalococcoidia bacterium]|nr:thiamine diphosphokinase [Dehalococcoidia bacterium]